MRHNAIISSLVCFLLIALVGNGLSATPTLPIVEISTPIHFLTPAGEDIEVLAGSYQVEAAESWLKLVPEGKERSAAILLEGTTGNHEEKLNEPVVRLKEDSENSDVFHLAVLLSDGTGIEAIGTASGVYTRSTRTSFIRRPSRSPYSGLAGRRLQGRLPGGSTTPAADCGPYVKSGGSADISPSPALIEFKGKLYNVVAMNHRSIYNDAIRHYVLAKEYKPYTGRPAWEGDRAGWAMTDKRVALAVFQDKLHMVYVHRHVRDKQLWHTWTADMKLWKQPVQIPGQYTKQAPALAVFNNKLHMVHLGKSSDNLWHSVFDGNAWTPNQKISGKKSWKTPALVVSPPELGPARLHMVHNVKNKNPFNPADFLNLELYHSIFEGSFWSKSNRIKGSFSKDATTLVTYGPRIHLFHLGKTSDNIWHLMYAKNHRTGKVEWFGNKRLHDWSSDSAVSVTRYKRCWHMMSKKGAKYKHHIFSAF